MIYFKVAELMGKRRMTKQKLSKETGIRPNTVASLWKGESKRIEIKHLDALCKALDCQPGDLFEYIPDKKED